MNLKFIREVSCDREYFGDSECPTHAVIEIDPKLLVWINKARKALATLKADGIELFDYTPRLKVAEVEGEEDSTMKDADEFRVDYMLLHITEDRIYWSICEKHSDIMFSISGIYCDELDENAKVLRTKPLDLPLLLEHLKHESSKILLNERMKTACPKELSKPA
jgi:hypothetical protein